MSPTAVMNDEEAIKAVITADESGEMLVTFSKQVADRLVNNGLKNAQIRNFFSEVRQIQTVWNQEGTKSDALRRLNMLKPKLAYQTMRAREVEYLRDVLTKAIDLVNRAGAPGDKNLDKAFKRFVDFYEAVLAYHYSAGDRR
jgi:CRISPR-associated protein Csm2